MEQTDILHYYHVFVLKHYGFLFVYLFVCISNPMVEAGRQIIPYSSLA